MSITYEMPFLGDCRYPGYLPFLINEIKKKPKTNSKFIINFIDLE